MRGLAVELDLVGTDLARDGSALEFLDVLLIVLAGVGPFLEPKGPVMKSSFLSLVVSGMYRALLSLNILSCLALLL